MLKFFLIIIIHQNPLNILRHLKCNRFCDLLVKYKFVSHLISDNGCPSFEYTLFVN